jgi:hypothetical protein
MVPIDSVNYYDQPMAEYRVMDPSRLIPSQDYLTKRAIKVYSGLAKNSDLWFSLLPVPILEVDNKFKIIDGHNQVATAILRGLEIPTLIINNPRFRFTSKDYPHISDEILATRNMVYSNRYDSVPFYEPCRNGERITSMKQLIDSEGFSY